MPTHTLTPADVDALAADLLADLGTVMKAVPWDEHKIHRDHGKFAHGAASPAQSEHLTSTPHPADAHARTLAGHIARVPRVLRERVGAWVRRKYSALSERYGHAAAKAILGAMVLLAPTPIPGSSLLPVALAEAVLRIRRALSGDALAKAVPTHALTDAEVHAIARELLAELHGHFAEAVHKGAWDESKHPRDHGRFAGHHARWRAEDDADESRRAREDDDASARREAEDGVTETKRDRARGKADAARAKRHAAEDRARAKERAAEDERVEAYRAERDAGTAARRDAEADAILADPEQAQRDRAVAAKEQAMFDRQEAEDAELRERQQKEYDGSLGRAYEQVGGKEKTPKEAQDDMDEVNRRHARERQEQEQRHADEQDDFSQEYATTEDRLDALQEKWDAEDDDTAEQRSHKDAEREERREREDGELGSQRAEEPDEVSELERRHDREDEESGAARWDEDAAAQAARDTEDRERYHARKTEHPEAHAAFYTPDEHARHGADEHKACAPHAMSSLVGSDGGFLVGAPAKGKRRKKKRPAKATAIAAAYARQLLTKAVHHAPKGGATVAGKKFTGGEFIPAEVMAQATEEEKAKVEGAGEKGNDEPEEWDGTIDQEAVKEGAGWDERNYAQWSDEDGTGHEIWLEPGTFTPPGSDEPVPVWRFVSFDGPGSDRDHEGEWVADRDDAKEQGRDYAEEHHTEARDPEDDDIEDVDGQGWQSRRHIAEYTDDSGSERGVRLERGTFEFGGQSHDCYRWTTYRDEDGEWTLDRDRAIEAGEEYARDNHHESEEEEDEDEDEEPEYEDTGGGKFDLAKLAPPAKRDVTLGAEKQPKSAAKFEIGASVDADEAHELIGKIFGTASPEEGQRALVACLGMPDDATVKVTRAGDYEKLFTDDKPMDGAQGVRVAVDHPKMNRVFRFVGIDHEGKRFVRNEIIEIKPAHQGEGLGADIFSKQAESAASEGLDYICTHAAGSSAPGAMNGYYTWPRFGYDQRLDSPASVGKTFDAARREFPDAKSVLDIMATPEGRDWWKANGSDLYDAKFDLEPEGRSLAVLSAYQTERDKKKAAKKST